MRRSTRPPPSASAVAFAEGTPRADALRTSFNADSCVPEIAWGASDTMSGAGSSLVDAGGVDSSSG
jgi:hypothetical protein